MGEEFTFQEVNLDDMRTENEERFAKNITRAWHEEGIVARVGEDPKVEEGRLKVYAEMGKFFALPEDLKRAHTIPKSDNQRGYTPNGVENSRGSVEKDIGKIETTEWREHFMVGPDIPGGHPFTQYRPLFFNPNVRTDHSAALVDTAVELMTILQQEEQLTYRGLGRGLNLKDPSLLAKLIAGGNSSMRLHHYPGFTGEIVGWKQVGEIRALEAKLENERTVYLVRADDHTDVDLSATLLGAQAPGLYVLPKDGNARAYTPKSKVSLVNPGDYIDAMTGSYCPSLHHWVAFMDTASARKPRLSIAHFIHGRPGAVIGVLPEFEHRVPEDKRSQTTEAEFLFNRLFDIGYLGAPDTNLRDYLLQASRDMNAKVPDGEMIKQVVAWHKAGGVCAHTQPLYELYKDAA